MRICARNRGPFGGGTVSEDRIECTGRTKDRPGSLVAQRLEGRGAPLPRPGEARRYMAGSAPGGVRTSTIAAPEDRPGHDH